MQKIKVSSNQRFLVTEDGQPFFWLGDTAWELFHRLTLTEAEHYLENRQRKGFNVIQAVALAELDGLQTPTPTGQLPLIDLDPTRPNEAYFDHIEQVIRRAAALGLYIGLLPTWGDKVNKGGGIGPQIFHVENAYHYGQYIGRRFRDFPNIIWINGGDRLEVENGVDYRPVWRALARGVQSQADQLMTYHPRGVYGSSAVFHDDDWLDMNMWQSGHLDIEEPIWDLITADYNRQPVKPVLDGEPCYEDIFIHFKRDNGSFTPYDIRRRMYRSVFAGACGVTYGHSSIWQMYAPPHQPVLSTELTWMDSLDRPAAFQMIHLRDLMLSRPYLTRIPAQDIIRSDVGTGTAHIRATRDSEGRYAMVYLPKASLSVTLDLTWMAASRAQVAWFDPRTGATTPIGVVPTAEAQTFATKVFGGPDEVLLLDAVD
jgi:hypothetical protein